jgi:hypothetical protein
MGDKLVAMPLFTQDNRNTEETGIDIHASEITATAIGSKHLHRI